MTARHQGKATGGGGAVGAGWLWSWRGGALPPVRWADFPAGWFGALLALDLLDVATTLTVLGSGGLEANPLANAALEVGPWVLLVGKAASLVLVVGVWLVFGRQSPRHRAAFGGAIAASVGIMLAVVGWNFFVVVLASSPT